MLLLLALVLSVSPAARKEAQRLAHQSITDYNVGDFDSALREATAAYKLDAKPALLFDLGQIHRALHHWERAEFFYRGYLRGEPDAPNRTMVEQLIAEMRKKQEAAPLPAPILVEQPPSPAPPAERPRPPAAPAPGRPAPAAAIAEPAPAAAVTGAPTPAKHPRALAIGLGAGALVAGGFAVAGALNVSSFNNFSNGLAPGSTDAALFRQDQASARGWELAGFVCLAVALGAAVGAVATW